MFSDVQLEMRFEEKNSGDPDLALPWLRPGPGEGLEDNTRNSEGTWNVQMGQRE